MILMQRAARPWLYIMIPIWLAMDTVTSLAILGFVMTSFDEDEDME
jgi:hypothetical protein